ncbi:programmed cell death 1 ligand 1-like isoform X2 [Centroberyx gerrardi]
MRMFDLNTEKMIWILLLLFLTSCVCGTFIVNVKQISYQAEENGNVTMEWIFPPKPDMSLSSLTIYCAKVSLNEEKPLYYLQNGVEDPESQHEQFAGRVRCDEHRLREGTIRFHLSRLRTNDSGVYLCEVSTGYGGSFRECSLTVTGKMGTAPDLPEDPEQREHGWFGLFGVVTAALVVLVALVAFTRQRCCPSKQQGQVQEENVDIGLRTDQTKTKSSSPQPKLLHT